MTNQDIQEGVRLGGGMREVFANLSSALTKWRCHCHQLSPVVPVVTIAQLAFDVESCPPSMLIPSSRPHRSDWRPIRMDQETIDAWLLLIWDFSRRLILCVEKARDQQGMRAGICRLFHFNQTKVPPSSGSTCIPCYCNTVHFWSGILSSLHTHLFQLASEVCTKAF